MCCYEMIHTVSERARYKRISTISFHLCKEDMCIWVYVYTCMNNFGGDTHISTNTQTTIHPGCFW